MTRKTPVILVADDEPIVAHTLVQILKEEGYDALYVSDGGAAVRWAREASPDVVICDVIMPTLNGVEAAKQIRTLLPKCHIILFSGQAAASELVHKAEMDGHRFELIAKPMRPEMLLALIKRLLTSESALASDGK